MFSVIMTIINISSLILIAVVYFREHYTIVDLETWNEIVNFCNDNGFAEKDEIATQNQGFFWDYVSEIEEEPEPEEEEDEWLTILYIIKDSF